MKLYEIQHINQDYNPNEIMGEELRFTHYISPITGEKCYTEKQPKDWQNVRRLSNMLFLAWNDDNPLEGSVYLGEFYNPESDDEKFYKFFERFNKFSINDDQKKMYSLIKRRGYTSGRRQCGATTLLLTIAAYEAVVNNKFVVYFGRNQDATGLYRRMLINTDVYNSNLDKNIKFRTFNTDMNIFRGRSNARVIVDNVQLVSPMIRWQLYDEYKYATEPIPDFKEYSINTY
jgi:hypothetical protein